jgi:hypothetical protein
VTSGRHAGHHACRHMKHGRPRFKIAAISATCPRSTIRRILQRLLITTARAQRIGGGASPSPAEASPDQEEDDGDDQRDQWQARHRLDIISHHIRAKDQHDERAHQAGSEAYA